MTIKRTHGLIVFVAVLIGVGTLLIPDRTGDDVIRQQIVETLRAQTVIHLAVTQRRRRQRLLQHST